MSDSAVAHLDAEREKKKQLQARLVATRESSTSKKPETKSAPAEAVGAQTDGSEAKKKSSLDSIPDGLELPEAMGVRLVKDQHGAVRVLYKTGQRVAVPLLESVEVEDLITQYVLDAHGPKGLKQAVEFVGVKLRLAKSHVTDQVKTFLRVGSRTNDFGETEYMLDLGSADGRMVVYGKNGWGVEVNKTVAFLKPDGQCPEPYCFDGPQAAYEFIEQWLRETRVPEDSHIMLAVLFADWLREDVPHAIIDCLGAPGSGKTTLVTDVMNTIDPTASGKPVMTEPNVKNITAVSTQRYLLTIDNSGHLKPDIQDFLCQVVTGTVVSERELYTNHGVSSVSIHRPVAITSINPAITAPDLQARAVRAHFAPRQTYKVDVTRSTEWQGKLLGALIELAVAGLQHQSIDPNASSKHRLAKFVIFGEGIAKALGHDDGHFSDAYTEAKARVARDYSEGDPVSGGIDLFLRAQETRALVADTKPSAKEIERHGGFCIKRSDGSYLAGFMPETLLSGAKLENDNKKRRFYGDGVYFPQNARALSSAMNRLMSTVLKDLGYEATVKPLGAPSRGKNLFCFIWRRD
jgi:energy-coupling factor transporter ATP-binding protein EcfA2